MDPYSEKYGDNIYDFELNVAGKTIHSRYDAGANAELTQEDVAKLLHRNKQMVVNWENGVTEIFISMMFLFVFNAEMFCCIIGTGDVRCRQ